MFLASGFWIYAAANMVTFDTDLSKLLADVVKQRAKVQRLASPSASPRAATHAIPRPVQTQSTKVRFMMVTSSREFCG